MRRFAAVMNHRSAGFKANAMGVWAVPDDELGEIGPRMAGFALVSHCYRRPTYDDWPYSVFTMVHGKNARECEETIAAIQAETGVDEYALLWSIKEYKKTRVKYFTPDWDEWSDPRGTQRARALSTCLTFRPVNPRPRLPHPAAAPAANATARVRRRAAGDAATPSRIDCSFVCSGCQPSARNRSFAMTHGCTRYGTTPGGISPIPSDHVTPQHARSSVAAGYAGTTDRGSNARSVVVREPAVGRDVEDAGVVFADHELECGDEVVDVDGLHGRRRAAARATWGGRAAAATAAAPRPARAPARCAGS